MYAQDIMQKKSEFDDDFFKPKIAVVGVGGGGNNTIHRLSSIDIKGASLYALNTDGKQLSMLPSNISSIMLGREITSGLGAGGYPEVGERAAELTRDKIAEIVRDKNLVFVTAGMGGGTGTGASPVVARIAKEQGAIVVGIVTTPFSLERVRLNTAKSGISKLRENLDTLIIIDNNRLVKLYPNLPIEKTFRLADEITAKAVRGITETITQPSLMNLDFADVRSIMGIGGFSVICVGGASGHDRADEVVKSTMNNKLLDVNVENAKGVLFHITGGTDLTLGEATRIGTKLTESVSDNAYVCWGARLDPSYKDQVEVIAIFTGVSGSDFDAGKKDDTELSWSRLSQRPRFMD